MFARQLNLVPLLLLAALLPVSQACNPKCKFVRCKNGIAFKPRLIDQSNPFLLRAHEKRWLPYICRKPTTYPLRLHSIKTGEARVRASKSTKRAVRISRYQPHGLTKRFGKRYFHLQKFRLGEWVVVREKSAGNQEKYVGGLCVTMPVRGYRYLNRAGKARGGWRKGRKGDCVSFRTMNAKMLVELRWNSTDDMDLSVEEPDGRVASRFRHHDACGKLGADSGSILGVCVNVPDKSESIRYFDCAPKGRYVIRVVHYRNCGQGGKYEVRVIREGRLVYSKVAESNRSSGSLVEEIALDL